MSDSAGLARRRRWPGDLKSVSVLYLWAWCDLRGDEEEKLDISCSAIGRCFQWIEQVYVSRHCSDR